MPERTENAAYLTTSLRVPYVRYCDDAEFEKHLSIVREQARLSQEIALFTEYSHRGYWPLDGVRRLAGLLKRRIAAYRRAGFARVGLNVLDTFGHMDDGWDRAEPPPMRTMVGLDGRVFRTCLCPTSDEFRTYIAEKYRILAGTGADFIWVDDDFKLKNHGGVEICFCPGCIARFNRAEGRSETFASLTEALRTDPFGGTADRWHRFTVGELTEVARIIRNAVRAADPAVELGMMTVPDDRFPEHILCFEAWMTALGARKGRPGSGFYTDATPTAILPKFLFCEYQLAHYPDAVTDRQVELENFPAQDFTKARTITKMEFLYGLMQGCTGISMSGVFGHQEERSLYDTREILERNAALFREVSRRAAALPDRGIYCSDPFGTGPRLMELSLPVTGDRKAACAFVLTGHAPDSYGDRELLELLSGALVVDAGALKRLEERGLARHCGARIRRTYDNAVLERLTDHPLNGAGRGYRRNAWVTFAGDRAEAAALDLTDEKTEVLSELQSLLGEPFGPCMTVFANELGGTVAVCAYLFPDSWQFEAKRIQWTNLFDRIVPGGLPVRVDLPYKIVPVVRGDRTGRRLVMLTNMTFDAAGPFDVGIAAEDLCFLGPDGGLRPAAARPAGGRARVRIDGLAPWESVFLTNF